MRFTCYYPPTFHEIYPQSEQEAYGWRYAELYLWLGTKTVVEPFHVGRGQGVNRFGAMTQTRNISILSSALSLTRNHPQAIGTGLTGEKARILQRLPLAWEGRVHVRSCRW